MEDQWLNRTIVVLIILLVLLTSGFSRAQENRASSGERVIVCMIQLEHAAAEDLAAVLKAFLSPQGSIVPDLHTNTLIIKDRAAIVSMLAEIIKGKPCAPDDEPPEVEAGPQQDEIYLDQ